ncbi:hypothetical protein EWM64_g1359 [Hericium alpestre]|uniref:Magnesium transporter n=1 Tax=Hericium alpestre TaxID=135208 RepID=A0A4Z0A8L1_9AGAM|nr:hypothetical protein EWM64_g1359 [Hericium alpestre]
MGTSKLVYFVLELRYLLDFIPAQSELEVAARIKAREERHYISQDTEDDRSPGDLAQSGGFLEEIITKSASRKPACTTSSTQGRGRGADGSLPPLPHQDYMLPDDGKSIPPKTKKSPVDDGPGPHQAWWLDVASPTWEDMRAIGKLLQLHPLTLEDILQQEPREKLELFPKLGYHFIVFRAIESVRTRKPFSFINKGGEASLGEEDIVGEVYVYLIVFKEGICTFHYSDISEHIERVRNKVLLTENTITKSSGKFNHVDMISQELEKEIVAIEDLVFSYGEAESMLSPMTAGPPKSSGLSRKKRDKEKASPTHFSPMDEKSISKDAVSIRTARTRFSVPPLTYSMALRRLRKNIQSALTLFPHRHGAGESASSSGNVSALKRMAKTRRLVTSLGRVLAMKSEVVARLRKRLLMSGEYGQLDRSSDDAEVAIYMGDVQDHILTLQQALSHYERTLSQSHPTHLLNLRVTVLRGRSSSDKAILILTTVTIGVLPQQTVIGEIFDYICASIIHRSS